MTTFIPTPGLGTLIEHSDDVHDVVKDKAEKVAALAVAIAPVYTGAFAESIHTEDDGTAVLVVADSVDEQGNADAAYIEFGTSDTPAHGTLRNALGAAASL